MSFMLELQVRESFLRGIHCLMSSVIASGETQPLYDLLRWCWAMSNHHQSEIVSLSTLLQSILFIPRTSNGFETTQRKRSTLVVEVIERLLRDAHSHNDASRILSALRGILDNNRQRESSTTSSASNTAFLVHDLFIR